MLRFLIAIRFFKEKCTMCGATFDMTGFSSHIRSAINHAIAWHVLNTDDRETTQRFGRKLVLALAFILLGILYLCL